MQGNAKSFLKAVLVGFGLALLVLSTALAMTPAGTQIQNQASASYIDSAGQPRTTTSNLVVTVVQQVYSFTITPDGPNENSPGQIKTALPGGQVIFNYVVTNTGNGTDTINLSLVQDTADKFDLLSPAIYLDANCNGNLDPGETAVTSVTLGMGQQACVIVRGTIPTFASDGQHGNLNLVGTSAGSPSVTDTNNWAQALATAQAALTASKSASPSGTVSPGDTITYTISGQNVGGSAAYGISVTVDGSTKTGILIADVIPTRLTVSSMPTGYAGAPGTILRFIYDDGTGWKTLNSSILPLTGNGTVKIGMLIEGTGAFFPVGAQYTFTFQAQVPSAASVGDSYANSATVQFDADNDGDANDPSETVTTNTTTNTVAAAYNVAVGPFGFPQGSATGDYTVGGYTVTRSGDQQTIASVNSGTTVIFRHTLKNTGNTADSFTLSFSGAPSGWACSLVADDLTTPISGPVGPLAANSDFNFALKCQVPATYTSSTATTITITATSVGDPSKSDTTTDVVSAVADGFRFDLYGGLTAPYEVGKTTDGLTHTSDDTSGSRPSISTTTANPGASVTYRLRVENRNPNNQADNYLLLVQPVLNFGQVDSVLFYADANDDGIPDGAPISNTGPVNFGDTFKYLAVVTLKANAAPVSVGFNFAAQSTASASEGLDWVYAQIDVNLVAQVTLDPDRSGTVTSPGTIQYTHTLTNNSNTGLSCYVGGNGGSYGWTYQYSTDGTNWFGALGNVFVGANGGTQTIYVRVLVPAGEPIGRTDVNTVQARCFVTYPSDPLATTPDAQDTATETTTIVGGELRVTKSAKTYVGTGPAVRDAIGATAFPGDVIEYTIEAENIGTGNLVNVKISDPIPAYTTFVSVSASATGFPTGSRILYSTDGTTWSATAPTSVPTGGVVYVAVDTNGDGTITDADTMTPAAKITIILQVQVQ
jgi:trimeric autotransporter adhesin